MASLETPSMPIEHSPSVLSCDQDAPSTRHRQSELPLQRSPAVSPAQVDEPQEARSNRRPAARRWRGQRGRRWRARGRASRASASRDALLAGGHPLAPSNTTDFLMDDHDDILEVDLLFDRYGQPTPRESPLADAEHVSAAAEWPLSLQLQPSMARLVAEHIQMESQVEELEARIALVRQRRASSDASDDEMRQGEVRMSRETAAKIRVLQAEIRSLEEENAALREGNERLAALGGPPSDAGSYTSDSESDSSTTSSASSASSRTSSSSSDSSSSGSASSPTISPRAPASV